MKRGHWGRAWVSLLVTMIVAGCATSVPPPQAEWDGLVREPNPRLDAVFIRPGDEHELAAFDSVMLDPLQVSFARGFETNRQSGSVGRRLNASDLQAIRDDLADLFKQVFGDELAAGGYELVDQPAASTLRVSPAIVDLFISAPSAADGARARRTYVATTGRMTLVVELRDSVTGELLGRAVDARSGRNSGQLEFANRVTNTADARRAIRVWARALREGLDELYARSVTAPRR